MEITAPDGRALEVLVAGPGDGFPLVFHHGTPQGAVVYPHLERPALERNLRVISYSRPGYGSSTPRDDGSTSATVADDARDVAVILDHLDVGEFVTLGWSGGGPRSLACAAVLPGRCQAATCLVGIVPNAEYDGDIHDGMGPENVEEYTAAFTSVEALEAFLERAAEGMSSVSADDIVAELGGLLPEVDKQALSGELAEYLALSMRRAMLQGIRGWRDDDLTHIRPWGFSVRDLTIPTAVWQGTEDLMVPFAHAEWLAANIPGVRRHFVEGEGHISLLARMGDILDDLLDMAGLP